MLLCPACRTPLTELAAEGTAVSLPVCAKCGGTWLDNPRSQRVVRGMISEVEKALAVHASSAGSSTAEPSYRVAAARAPEVRLCADCAAPMAQTTVKDVGIVLDACPAHGTWFDARELAAVAESFALKAASDDADAAEFVQDLAQAKRQAAASGLGPGASLLSRLLR